MTPSPIIVDIQCFTDNKRSYILKEVCVLELDTGVLRIHHVALPPYNKSMLTPKRVKGNKWLTRNFHGLTWDQGDISYYDLHCKLTTCISLRSTVYVKGLEKKIYLEMNHVRDPAFTKIIDICNIGCEPLTTLYKQLEDHVHMRCVNHVSIYSRCALTNCIAVRNWLLKSDQKSTRSECSYLCSCFFSGHDTVDAQE